VTWASSKAHGCAKGVYIPINLKGVAMHENARGKQVEYVCTAGMGKILGAQGYDEMNMVNIEHAYNTHTHTYTYYGLSLGVKYCEFIDHMVSYDLTISP